MHTRVSLLRGNQVSSCRIHFAGEWVTRLEGLVAQVAENVPVEIICAAFGDNVDDSPGGTPILRVVIAQNHLEFLHVFLRNRRADPVHRVIHSVRAVHADHVRSRASPADIQSTIRRRADRRRNVARGLGIQQRKIDVIAPVGRQIVNLALVHGLRTFRTCHFDLCACRGHRDRLRLRAQYQFDVCDHLSANRQLQ